MTSAFSDTPRWGGYSHEQIYRWVQAGSGQGASQYAEGQWSAMWFVIQYVEARLSGAIADIGSGWEGQAATATASGVTPLGAWALDTADQAQRTNRALSAQASDANHVQMSMPPPQYSALPEDPPDAIGFTRADLADWSAQDQARNEQARRAVDLMTQYTDRSSGNFTSFGAFATPPVVVVDGSAGPGGGGGGGRPGGASAGAVPEGGLGAAPVGIGGASTGATAPGPVPHASASPGGMPSVAPADPVGTAGAGPVAPSVGAAPPPVARPPSGAGPGGTAPVAPARPSPVAPPRSTPVGPAVRPGSPPTRSRVPIDPGGRAGFRPVIPGVTRPDPHAAAPLGPFSGGTGSNRSGGPGSGSGTGPGGGPASPGGSTGRGPSLDGGTGRGVGEPLPPPARTPVRSPDNPFPSVGGTADPARGGGRPGAAGAHPGVMPMGAGVGAGAGSQTHRRPDYLVEDGDPFADDRWFTPPVIGADNLEDDRG